MSEQTTQEDAHALVGAYVLDALDPGEREAFERHLAACPDCQAEVPGMRAAAARVAATAYVRPPAHLKSAVLAQVARTRQLPPVVTAVSAPVALAWWRRPLALAAAVVVLAAAALSAVLGVQLHESRQREAQIAAIIAHPEVSREVALRGGGSATLDVAGGRAVVRMRGAAAPPSGRVYELWVVPSAGSPRPAGLMDSGSGGALVKQVTGAKALAVTVEPAGGSERPTLPPVVVLTV
ncbi:anti-sigma-K factor RskA [Motilibacter rhizosphaerae]|uniref:Regulator of SigK n=1 Tax=Motilibacter rhizosphaerae TaxID=598652 RepID=A0A4V2F3G0_9ACTN|nr:anti-sigma factor [Motilibacter rhizosphaerae]RZS82983.1 anti-sigma-K factor RskA [Motilibacter rhizosphaerae]